MPAAQEAKPIARVLVVDDDPQVSGLLKLVLEKAGFSSDTVASSEDALKEMGRRRYEVLVLDMNLPGMNGLEFFELYRRTHPYTEAIIVTGEPQLDDAIDFVRAGAFDYLSKPFSNEKLVEKVKAATMHRRERIEMDMAKTAQFALEERPLAKYVFIKPLGGGCLSETSIVEKDFDYFALKRYRPLKEFSQDSDSLAERFVQINQRLHKIDHPNVARIFEHGFQEGRDKPYVVMDYVRGQPLREAMRSGQAPFAARLDILRQIVSAVSRMHEASIVHGDISAESIFIDEISGAAKFIEFGVSSLFKHEFELSGGKPQWDSGCLPPERLSDPSSPPEMQGDVFSLGAVAYELLTGCKAFEGSCLKAGRPVNPKRLNKDLPEDVCFILGSMLQLEPAGRVPSDEALSALNIVCTMPDMADTVRERFNVLANSSVWR